MVDLSTESFRLEEMITEALIYLNICGCFIVRDLSRIDIKVSSLISLDLFFSDFLLSRSFFIYSYVGLTWKVWRRPSVVVYLLNP